MKSLLAIVLVTLLTACGSSARPALPQGVTCDDEATATIHDVPDKADPASADYNEVYAVSWYMGHGCDGTVPTE
jgi:hypothetical protein